MEGNKFYLLDSLGRFAEVLKLPLSLTATIPLVTCGQWAKKEKAVSAGFPSWPLTVFSPDF